MNHNSTYKKVEILNSDNEIIISATRMNLFQKRITLHGYDFPLIDHNTRVKVIGYLEDGIVSMEGEVTLSIESQINLDILGFDAKNDRRRYLKVKTNLSANLLKAYGCGNSKKYFNIYETVETRDLSVGGICFFTNRTFLNGQRLLIDLYPIKTSFIVEAIVLRRRHNNNKLDYRYRYACKFINLDYEQQRALCEYVFRVQIENHKKKMNKGMNHNDL